jgi:4-aminobutyrate aminotransferase
MARKRATPSPLNSEGDVNLTPRRKRWENQHLGPATRKLLAADAKHFLHQSLSTPCFNALQSVKGIWLEDLEGRRYMDFHGNNVHQVGHGHPKVLEAVKRQLDALPFSPRRFTNVAAVELARRLAKLTGGALGKVLFAPGGAEAISMALKLARVATGRHKTVSMWDSFHGATLDAISVGGEAVFRRGIGPLLPGAEHAPPCDPGACLYGCNGTCNARCAEYVEYMLAREGDVAAVVVETVRCTDVQIPPRSYYETLRRACDRHGALLILDEIPICLGRTGKMFAFEHYGIVPDMVVIGKGLGGGVMPMAALLARTDLDVAGRGALGHFTHEKSSLGCAAGLATLEVIEEERLLQRSTRLGARALAQLKAMKTRQPRVAAVRGIGLLLGVELDSPALAEDVLYRCLAKGLSFKVGQGNVINLSPPLVIEEADLGRALNIVEQSIKEE